MKKYFFLTLLFCSQLFASTAQNIPQILMKEWNEFHQVVNELEPQGDVGGYMLYREYGQMTLLWRTFEYSDDSSEVIRFYMERRTGQSFAVTYHKSDIIRPGRTVLRRFIGTEPTGWINHTIDFETGEYLGTQGSEPQLTGAEKKMLSDWGITFL